MNRPMSRRRRLFTLSILVLVFFLVGPVLILYSSGYSLASLGSLLDLNLQTTGGIYVSNIGNDGRVFVDGELVAGSSFFGRPVLIQRLDPENHLITVERSGFRPWSKNLTVYPNKVTEVSPLIIPEKVVWSTVEDENLILNLSKSLEKKKELLVSTTTGTMVLDDGHVSVETLEELIKVKWAFVEDAPQYICSLTQCDAISLEMKFIDTVVDVEWYMDSKDGLVVAVARGLYVVEFDSRGGRITTKIFSPQEFNLESFSEVSIFQHKGDVFMKAGDDYYTFDFDLKSPIETEILSSSRRSR